MQRAASSVHHGNVAVPLISSVAGDVQKDIYWHFVGSLIEQYKNPPSRSAQNLIGLNVMSLAPITPGSSLVEQPSGHLDSPKKFDHEAPNGFGTRAIHVGSEPEPSTGAVIPSISLSTTYKQDDFDKNKVRLDASAMLIVTLILIMI
jgi:hypothetical protein